MVPRASTVLILSEQPLVAALFGLLVELLGQVPAFAGAGESPEDALARVRPLLVVLLDSGLEAARSDLFFARAAKRKVGLAVFGTRRRDPHLASVAESRGIPWLEVPTTAAQFADVLDRAAHTVWWRTGEERRAPRVQRAPDGALTYVDRDGRRWQVYDRRAADRRQGRDRVFVSDVGESYRYALTPEESEPPHEPSLRELERQLAEAKRRG